MERHVKYATLPRTQGTLEKWGNHFYFMHLKLFSLLSHSFHFSKTSWCLRCVLCILVPRNTLSFHFVLMGLFLQMGDGLPCLSNIEFGSVGPSFGGPVPVGVPCPGRFSVHPCCHRAVTCRFTLLLSSLPSGVWRPLLCFGLRTRFPGWLGLRVK